MCIVIWSTSFLKISLNVFFFYYGPSSADCHNDVAALGQLLVSSTAMAGGLLPVRCMHLVYGAAPVWVILICVCFQDSWHVSACQNIQSVSPHVINDSIRTVHSAVLEMKVESVKKKQVVMSMVSIMNSDDNYQLCAETQQIFWLHNCSLTASSSASAMPSKSISPNETQRYFGSWSSRTRTSKRLASATKV